MFKTYSATGSLTFKASRSSMQVTNKNLLKKNFYSQIIFIEKLSVLFASYNTKSLLQNIQ